MRAAAGQAGRCWRAIGRPGGGGGIVAGGEHRVLPARSKPRKDMSRIIRTQPRAKLTRWNSDDRPDQRGWRSAPAGWRRRLVQDLLLQLCIGGRANRKVEGRRLAAAAVIITVAPLPHSLQTRPQWPKITDLKSGTTIGERHS